MDQLLLLVASPCYILCHQTSFRAEDKFYYLSYHVINVSSDRDIHIISDHDIHFISDHVIADHVFPDHLILDHVILDHVISDHVIHMPIHVIYCHLLPFNVIKCHILSVRG